jgi:hypothetical protein
MKKQSGNVKPVVDTAEKDSLKFVPISELFEKLNSSAKGLSGEEAKKDNSLYMRL